MGGEWLTSSNGVSTDGTASRHASSDWHRYLVLSAIPGLVGHHDQPLELGFQARLCMPPNSSFLRSRPRFGT
jgi:hypothetical protein